MVLPRASIPVATRPNLVEKGAVNLCFKDKCDKPPVKRLIDSDES